MHISKTFKSKRIFFLLLMRDAGGFQGENKQNEFHHGDKFCQLAKLKMKMKANNPS